MIKKKIIEMFLSKRFVAFLLCLICFLVLLLYKDIEPVALGTALSFISAIYVAGESLRSSVSKMVEKNKENDV